MLPFLKRKEEQTSPGLIVKTRTPDKTDENQDDSSSGIEACAKDLLDAIKSNDIKAIADAMKAAFTILDGSEHVEGPHIEPHSYQAQNEKAAKNE